MAPMHEKQLKPVVVLGPATRANPASRVPFIERYYRAPSGPLAAILSAFQLHNQTMNIWTHLFGAVYFTYMALAEWELPEAWLDRFTVLLLIGAAITCFIASATYHTLLSVSDGMAQATLVVDILGIVGLILASFVAGLRVGFYCSPVTGVLYLTATVVMLGTAAAMLVVPSLRDDPAWGPIRTAVLASSVAWGLVPASHWVITAPGPVLEHSIWGCGGMFLLYGAGFLLYSFGWPERLAPGSFDLFFASHQWWHVATFLAALVWTANIVQAHSDFLGPGQSTCDDVGNLVLLPHHFHHRD